MSESFEKEKAAIGRKIQELREKSGLSQRAMARELLMDSKQYATLETGTIDIRSTTLIRIARVHQIPVGELLSKVDVISPD